uniref:Uncharacterized protein n=1 Tax=Chrysoporthe deuterocubensis TaxID=764597 RepID=A0A191MX38_9PEZI|nr:hypothetical protein [Chrysoporthe deuterocubensis]AMX22169.1 hypothetical protein [Chrysoporthe deuterocubensis]
MLQMRNILNYFNNFNYVIIIFGASSPIKGTFKLLDVPFWGMIIISSIISCIVAKVHQFRKGKNSNTNMLGRKLSYIFFLFRACAAIIFSAQAHLLWLFFNRFIFFRSSFAVFYTFYETKF